MPETLRIPVRVNPLLLHPDEQRVSLRGEWQFRLDPDDVGLREGWQEDPACLTERIAVPGCWQGQGFGGEGNDRVWDFNLEARTFRATYTGTAWYAKTIQPPAGWQGRRIWVNFGGVHPSAEIWLNGVKLGESHFPFAPFGFEVTEAIRFGEDNTLVARVHEQDRMLGFAFSWQGNWSGLYRDVELTATGASALAQCAVLPDVDAEAMTVRATIDGYQAGLRLRVSAYPVDDPSSPVTAEIPVTGTDISYTLPMPAPRLWSPETPDLYRVDLALVQGERVLDAQSERTGFVKLTTAGKHFLINNAPYYLRGSGDFLSCPETGSPDTDRDRWRRKLQALRDYGYNYVRCQSYVYGPEYYDAADEVGIIVQSEMGTLGAWGSQTNWHVYGWPRPTLDFRHQLERQWNAVVQRDVNHPSATFYCMSNELGASTFFPRFAWRCYHETKAIKPTAMVIWTDGGYAEELPGDFVNDEASVDEKCAKPVVQHEYRWWSSFPDVTAMDNYRGAVRPYSAQMALEVARRRGQEHLLPAYVTASQRLQFLEAKAKMELCRRDFPMLAGICHFDAMDANPSPQGIITEFYERKYADADAWLQTNGDTVLLCSLNFDNRVLAAGETFRCDLSVSDFSHPPLQSPELRWQLLTGAQEIAGGTLAYAHQPFRTCAAGQIAVTIPAVTRPQAARLVASLVEGDRTVTNEWNLWLFPAASALPETVEIYGAPQWTWLKSVCGLPSASLTPGTVVLTERIDDALVAFMRAGGRVILAASEGMLRFHQPLFGFAKYFFTPPANYGPYEDGQNGTIIRSHLMLGDLPHEGFADFQLFRLIEEAAPLDLEPLELTAVDPTIRVIHRYPVLHPLGYLTEARVGSGGLVLCALNLDQSLPEARYLLACICRYAADGFQPQMTLSESGLARLVDVSV